MVWRGPERRRQPRPSGNPTYIVEQDAPDWEPPQPFWARWRRQAIDTVKRNRYDAYPDHIEPFENLRELPVPEPPRRRMPKHHGEVHLMVVGRKNAKLVPLAGVSLDRLDLSKRLVGSWVLNEIRETCLDVFELDEEADKGQGLAEYALILALIAIVAIAALLLLGGQIAEVIETIGNQIPGGATPAP